MFVGACVIIIGSIVISTGMTLAQFVVGRFILGVGIQIMVVSAPAYAVEISPPHWRGRAVGKNAISFVFSSRVNYLSQYQASITVVGLEVASPPLRSHTARITSTPTTNGAFPSFASASPASWSSASCGLFPSLPVGSSRKEGRKKPLLSWSSITAMEIRMLVSFVLRLKR